MDAIELARQHAEAIHYAAAGLGDDLWKPLALVHAEAGRRGVEIYPLPVDDPQLKSGRAVFDSQARTILHEDVGSDFDRAFLIAHELGHVVLEGGTTDSVATDVDPTRSTEDAPVGLERVVDYNRRERREVRMDLFARELLLPRSAARRHYLEAGMSAADLAARLGAPLDVVMQQLLDALLLPVAKMEVRSEAKPHKPDPAQADAVRTRNRPFQLQAGPGTGKTHTLVNRVGQLLREGVDPASILVLTFSNKAASELGERIAALDGAAAAAMWIGTFHSFGLDIVRRFHERLQLPASPRLVDRTEAIELLEDELAKIPLKHYRNLWDPTLELSEILGAISRAKDEVIDAMHYRRLAEAMPRVRAGDEKAGERVEKCLEVADIYLAYEKLLKARGGVDFGDLVALPARLLEDKDDSSVRQALADRHRYVLVDEYQDVNRASVRLLKGVAGEGSRLWVVGDSRQSIYRFRGASSINMARFSTDFPAAEAVALETNYRSYEEIIGTYAAFSKKMQASGGALPLNLHAARGTLGKRPELRIAGTPEDEISVVAGAIQELHAAGTSYRDHAVLCAGNQRLAEIAAGLEARGIPVLFLGSIFERDEIKELLCYLSLLQDRFGSGLARIGSQPRFAMPLEDVSRLVRHAREDGQRSWRTLDDRSLGISDQAKDTLARLRQAFDGFGPQSNPWGFLAAIVLDRTDIARALAQSDSVGNKLKAIAIWQFLNFCRSQPAAQGLPASRLLARIRRLLLLSDDRDLRQLPGPALRIDGVRLMTIHGSKGLEFPVVHIPGMIKTGLPRNNRAPRCPPPDRLIEGSEGITGAEAVRLGHDEEEQCIFFVGLSRARDRLLLYASSKMENGNKRGPSDFLSVIDGLLERPGAFPRLAAATPQPAKLAVTWPSPPQLTGHHVNQFNNCPLRFFYTHVMKLGGQRAETPFMRMHDALQLILDWIGKEFPTSNPKQEDLAIAFAEAWKAKGPAEHPYAEDYRGIAQRLVTYLLDTREGQPLQQPKPLALKFGDSEIVVVPNDVIGAPDGSIVVRRVKTGKLRSDEFDDLEYTILSLAARAAYGPRASVQAVHLASETTETATLSDEQLNRRRSKAAAALGDIRAGNYPAKPDARRCPRCPHLFICAAVPTGTIQAKI